MYINWLNMVRAGLLSLEFYSPDTQTWKQASLIAYNLFAEETKLGISFYALLFGERKFWISNNTAFLSWFNEPQLFHNQVSYSTWCESEFLTIL